MPFVIAYRIVMLRQLYNTELIMRGEVEVDRGFLFFLILSDKTELLEVD